MLQPTLCAQLSRRRALDALLSSPTVLQDWFAPMRRALERVRFSDALFGALPMAAFALSGGLRHLLAARSLREHLQSLLHLETSHELPPIARSTWADALASSTRRDVLRSGLAQLTALAQQALPDQLAHLEGLGNRPVVATDATYQTESTHYRPEYVTEGGQDNPKGHLLLSSYDLRRAIALSVHVATQSMGEMRVLKQALLDPSSPLQLRRAVHVVDRAFIDGRFWDQCLRQYQSTVITRMKSSLNYTVVRPREVAATPTNRGVTHDFEITLQCSHSAWRLIGFTAPDGTLYEYVTNDLQLPAGVVAFLYHRRWDKEKYYDCFKNDLAGAKAWGKREVAIEQQALLGMMTVTLTRLFLQRRQEDLGLSVPDETQKAKHALKRRALSESETAIPLLAQWTYLSKLTRQLWRFLKNCFAKKHDPGLYKRQLEPLLRGYL